MIVKCNRLYCKNSAPYEQMMVEGYSLRRVCRRCFFIASESNTYKVDNEMSEMFYRELKDYRYAIYQTV